MALLAHRLRVWLQYYRDEVRLVVTTAIFAAGAGAFVAALVWLVQPAGPVKIVEGQIAALGYQETKFGSLPSATVQIDDRTVRVELPARLNCAAGDRIVLKRSPTRLGFLYGVGRNPRPCSRD